MNKTFKRLAVFAVMALVMGIAAQAQFRFGIKAGIAANSLHFDEKTFDSSNRCGFTGGLMAEFTVPLIGVGGDVSVLYQHREAGVEYNANGVQASGKMRGDYIDIPLNFKYKLALPAVSNIVCPFVTTGPDFSFLLSKKNVNNALSNKSFDFAWNVGLGVELVRHVQIAASYGFGITNHASGEGNALYDSKNRCWTVTAAYLF